MNTYKMVNSLKGRLIAEKASDLSNSTIEKVFKNTCFPEMLTQQAKKYRDDGLLDLNGEVWLGDE